MAHTLHYGGGAFEGIRFYETARGPAIFRLEDHVKRLFYSAAVLKMNVPYSPEQISSAITETVRANRISQGYIRPIIYYGAGVMGLNPKSAPVEVAIATWPWGAYLPHEALDIKISSYIRIHPRSTVTDAKLSGHYVNSILAVLEIDGSHYHEALFLDANGNLAEGSGENFFMVKNRTLCTPPLGTILAGITRDTVIQIAASIGLPVSEETISPEQALLADEAFFTGTAAEVTPIRSINDQPLGSGTLGPLTEQIRTNYLQIVKGQDQKFDHYLTYL